MRRRACASARSLTEYDAMRSVCERRVSWPNPEARLQPNEKLVIVASMAAGAFNSAQLVIRRFGGQSALAQLLGRRQSTVEHWAATGWIPARWQPTLMALARKKAITLAVKGFVSGEPHDLAPAAGRLG